MFKYNISTLKGGMGFVRENADFTDQLRGVKVKNADVIFEWELDEKYASMS